MKNKHHLGAWIELVCSKEERWWLEQGSMQTDDSGPWLQGVIFPECSACPYRRGLREKIYLLQRGRDVDPRCWALSKSAFLMKSFICCAADCCRKKKPKVVFVRDVHRVQMEAKDGGMMLFAWVMENSNVQPLVTVLQRPKSRVSHRNPPSHSHTRKKFKKKTVKRSSFLFNLTVFFCVCLCVCFWRGWWKNNPKHIMFLELLSSIGFYNTQNH